MKKIVITGGTGFIGLSLAAHLTERGYEPVLVARNKPPQSVPYPFHEWDGVNAGAWKETLNGALAVVNLAGKTVDCVKTPDNCDLILRSRVDSVKAVGAALRKVSNPPAIWVQMSTAHICGDPPKQVCTESSATGYGLAPFVGKAWEKALLQSVPENTREVRLRTSFVIGKNGGALSVLVRLAKMGLGGQAGNGTQGFSWIHEFDMNDIILNAIENEAWQGAVIASAPNPVSNKEFMRELRRKAGVPFGLPAPAFAIKFGAKYLLNTDPELVLYGRYVKSERLDGLGYTFKFPNLPDALEDLLGKKD